MAKRFAMMLACFAFLAWLETPAIAQDAPPQCEALAGPSKWMCQMRARMGMGQPAPAPVAQPQNTGTPPQPEQAAPVNVPLRCRFSTGIPLDACMAQAAQSSQQTSPQARSQPLLDQQAREAHVNGNASSPDNLSNAARSWLTPVGGPFASRFMDANYREPDFPYEHLGQDIDGAENDPVVSPVDGVVVVNCTDEGVFNSALIVRESTTGFYHVLGHIKSDIQPGGSAALVNRGQVVGSIKHWMVVDKEGRQKDNSHLHWGVNQKFASCKAIDHWGWGIAPAYSTRADASERGWIDISAYIRPRFSSVTPSSNSQFPAATQSQPNMAIQTPPNPGPGRSYNPGTVIMGQSVTIAWGGVSGASYYDFGIRDMTENRLVVDKQAQTTSFSTPLQAGHTYRWNVRACANPSACSDFTTPLYFTMQTEQAAMPPQYSAPQQAPTQAYAPTRPAMPGGTSPGRSYSPGPMLPGTTAMIGWASVPGAEFYDFGIRDMTAGRLVVDTQSSRTSYSARLEAGHTYRWNVRACAGQGNCSEFTAPLYFTMEAVQSAYASGSSGVSGGSAGAAPSPPSMPSGTQPGSSGSPGPTLASTTVRIGWNRVSGATTYDFGIKDMIANSLVVDTQTSGTSYSVQLQPHRTYRWNVRACNQFGCSGFTPVIYFSTP